MGMSVQSFLNIVYGREWHMDPQVARGYAEEVGIALGQMGTSSSCGALLGWLMICDPPQQTTAQLCQAMVKPRGVV